MEDYLQAIERRIPQAFAIEDTPFSVSFHTDNGDMEIIMEQQGNNVIMNCVTPLT